MDNEAKEVAEKMEEYQKIIKNGLMVHDKQVQAQIVRSYKEKLISIA